jgi:hypothetical protein
MRVDPKYVLAAAVAAAVLGAPLAIAAGEGDPILGGERNPSPNPSVELNDETEIIAQTVEYGTRQSNKGSGGGAIYGCRASRQAGEQREIACLRANNLRNGRAFSFETDGPVAGEIEVGDPASQPFATNGRGKVENLNADMVDSTDVGPIIARVLPGQQLPRPLVSAGSLSVQMSCGADGDVNVTATTDEDGIIHGFAHGIEEGQGDWEAKDDTFGPGQTFVLSTASGSSASARRASATSSASDRVSCASSAAIRSASSVDTVSPPPHAANPKDSRAMSSRGFMSVRLPTHGDADLQRTRGMPALVRGDVTNVSRVTARAARSAIGDYEQIDKIHGWPYAPRVRACDRADIAHVLRLA